MYQSVCLATTNERKRRLILASNVKNNIINKIESSNLINIIHEK